MTTSEQRKVNSEIDWSGRFLTGKIKANKWQNVCACLAAILIGLLLINILILQSIQKQITPQKPKETELNIVIIEKKDCKECFNATAIAEALKQIPDSKILSQEALDYQENKAKTLIEKYGLTKVPVVLITGDIDNIPSEGITKVQDALVIYTPPLNFDLKEQKLKGEVQAILLKNKECKKCVDLSIILTNLKLIGVNLEEKEVDVNSEEGKELVDKYKITKVPSLIFNKELLSYEPLKESWQNVGTTETDGMLVMRQIPPPYFENGKLVGLVDVLYLTDKTCKECYGIELHKQIFAQNFKMEFSSEKELDIANNEGKKIIAELNITKIPTVVLSGDIDKYSALVQLWSELGTVEKGKYVFRNLDRIGVVYKDLSTGKIVNATQET